MQVVIRSKPGSLRTSMSFSVSAAIHGTILAWLAFSPQQAREPRRLTLYEQQIQPNEKRIVWYHVADRLPDVRPTETSKSREQPRAIRRFDQSIVAGNKEKLGSSQMIFMPAPEIPDPKPLPLPNVLAVSRPARPVRKFMPPPEMQLANPRVPDAPDVAAPIEQRSMPLASRPARPLKNFNPPPEAPAKTAKLTLPDAPRVAGVARESTLPADLAKTRVQPRGFTPPPTPAVRATPVAIPEAPGIAGLSQARNLPLAVPDPRAPLKRFSLPTGAGHPSPATPAADLPTAPEVGGPHQAGNLPLAVPDPRAPLRRFNPPPAAAGPAHAAASAADLPAAPEVGGPHQAGNLPLAVPDPRAPLRRFNPPPGAAGPARAAASASELPAAPEVGGPHQTHSLPLAVPDPRAPLRRFNPPPGAAPAPGKGQSASPAELPTAPSVAGASGNAEATLAIVGLNPTRSPDFPTPPGSVQGGFSAGPKPKATEGAGADGSIVVPWLTARGGTKDNPPPTLATVNADPMAKENLLAAARNALRGPSPDSAMPNATRVSSAPDARLAGKAVYSIAIQMPNVTSFSGSWIVWFSERQPVPGAPPPEVRAPVPLRKVDPKYVAEAAQERVEGTVRLFAVIRRDGHVESVSLLRHLDDRLDRSAQEALSKWVFEPALRNGAPMDIEAVFEIPFHLAPRSPR